MATRKMTDAEKVDNYLAWRDAIREEKRRYINDMEAPVESIGSDENSHEDTSADEPWGGTGRVWVRMPGDGYEPEDFEPSPVPVPLNEQELFDGEGARVYTVHGPTNSGMGARARAEKWKAFIRPGVCRGSFPRKYCPCKNAKVWKEVSTDDGQTWQVQP